MPTLSLDAMGGERGPAVAVAAAVAASAARPDTHIVLAGPAATLEPLLEQLPDEERTRLSIRNADQVVAMDEHPRAALRYKKRSSMRVAIEMVAAGESQAAVSCGNTGALMAIARFVLRTVPGIKRPAIISAIPAIDSHTHMLDLGANADCTPRHLFEFAQMGAVVARDLASIAEPRVGLLNIGEEAIKGTHTVREAASLIEKSNINYVGFVEGHDIFSGALDVVVTDGFTGNIALKTMEGFARLVRHRLAQAGNPLAHSGSIDPRHHNGASLVGLRGIVVKSHGNSDPVALSRAIEMAFAEIDKDVPARIAGHLATNP